jgi:hypothetical protein
MQQRRDKSLYVLEIKYDSLITQSVAYLPQQQCYVGSYTNTKQGKYSKSKPLATTVLAH